jgi:hypothetical protein
LSSNEIYLVDAIDVIEEVLASGGEFKMYPKGISMLPLIRQGVDSVVLVRDKDASLKKQDIAFYKRDNGQFVLHRVMSCEADGTYTMCGDNQTFLEAGIRADQIIAKVARLYRKEKLLRFDGVRYKIYLATWCSMRIRLFLRLPKRAVAKIKRICTKREKTVD